MVTPDASCPLKGPCMPDVCIMYIWPAHLLQPWQEQLWELAAACLHA